MKEWNVSDIDPVTMFPKDCRYYNGGAVATKEEQKKWQTIGYKDKSQKRKWPIFIDRLRKN